MAGIVCEGEHPLCHLSPELPQIALSCQCLPLQVRHMLWDRADVWGCPSLAVWGSLAGGPAGTPLTVANGTRRSHCSPRASKETLTLTLPRTFATWLEEFNWQFHSLSWLYYKRNSENSTAFFWSHCQRKRWDIWQQKTAVFVSKSTARKQRRVRSCTGHWGSRLQLTFALTFQTWCMQLEGLWKFFPRNATVRRLLE